MLVSSGSVDILSWQSAVLSISVHLPLSAGRVVLLWSWLSDVTFLSCGVRMEGGSLVLDRESVTFILISSATVCQIVVSYSRFSGRDEFHYWNVLGRDGKVQADGEGDLSYGSVHSHGSFVLYVPWWKS